MICDKSDVVKHRNAAQFASWTLDDQEALHLQRIDAACSVSSGRWAEPGMLLHDESKRMLLQAQLAEEAQTALMLHEPKIDKLNWCRWNVMRLLKFSNTWNWCSQMELEL